MCRSPEVPNAEFCPGLDFSVIQTRTSHKSRAGKLLHQSQNAWAWLVDDPTRRDRVKLTGEVDSSVAAQIDYTRWIMYFILSSCLVFEATLRSEYSYCHCVDEDSNSLLNPTHNNFKMLPGLVHLSIKQHTEHTELLFTTPSFFFESVFLSRNQTPEILLLKIHSIGLAFPLYNANSSGRSFTKTLIMHTSSPIKKLQNISFQSKYWQRNKKKSRVESSTWKREVTDWTKR